MLLVGGRTPEPVALRVTGGEVTQCAPTLEPQEAERVLDLGGRFVRHGLRDAHVHLGDWAHARRQVDLSAARSAEHAAAMVGNAARELPEGAVVRGTAFRDAVWPDAPSGQLLQRAAPDRVVVLRSMDMHTAWLSPAACALAGLPDHPTGLLREHEAWDALARLPAPSADEDEDDDAVRDAVAAAHRRGLTAAHDFSFAGPYDAWLRRRQEHGELPLRVTAVVQPGQLASFAERGLATGDGDAFLRVGPLKLFADGSLGARTARCLTPYADGTGRGIQLLDPEQLRAELEQARRAGFAVAVHAIGDEATRDVLSALQAAGVRASVEHAQLLRREDLPLFRAGGIVASVQPAHLLDDADLVDELWRDSPSLPYAVRSLVDAGAEVAFGSDAPVSPLDPWRSIAAAVHRTDGSREPWGPREAVPLDTALAASGARRLRPGNAADLVVLDVPDPGVLSPAELATAPVFATFLDGRCVHGPWAG